MVKDQPIILALETCSEICSVALFNGMEVIANKHVLKENSHSALLTPLIEECINEAGIKKSDLSAIAVGMGPGSYTGLRVGLSTAKGLAYALNIPIIPINTLKAMALGMKKSLGADFSTNTLLIPMIEARRMEVYSATFSLDFEIVHEIRPVILDDPESNLKLTQIKNGVIGGNGAEKCVQVPTLSHLNLINDPVINALNFLEMANSLFEKKDFLDTAYCEPFYLKSPPLKKPKKLI